MIVSVQWIEGDHRWHMNDANGFLIQELKMYNCINFPSVMPDAQKDGKKYFYDLNLEFLGVDYYGARTTDNGAESSD